MKKKFFNCLINSFLLFLCFCKFIFAQENSAAIFAYHRFGEQTFPSTNIKLKQFKSHINEIKKNNYNVLPINEIIDHIINKKPLPKKTIGLTIDDGFKSIYNNAWPLIKAAGLPVTIFVTTGTIGSGSKNHMTWKEIKELSDSGVTIGHHTVNHYHLVNKSLDTLENEIEYSFNKDDMYLNISANVYQNLREKENSDQYEFILPNILYGKTFFTEKFGTINFKSNALYSKYETNKQKTFLTNDIIWNSSSYITKKGFLNTFEGMVRNTNYETNKTNKYKDGKTIHELRGVLANKISLPMKKDGINYSNLFSPNFMVRYAPGHMRDLSG